MEDTFSLGNVLLYGEFPSKGKEKQSYGRNGRVVYLKNFRGYTPQIEI